MISKFLDYVYSKRKPIGYTVGGLNVLVGVNHLLHGDFGLALLWFAIGMMLVMDAYEFK
jgi:hypothetical protein